jgi:hypothetical protein
VFIVLLISAYNMREQIQYFDAFIAFKIHHRTIRQDTFSGGGGGIKHGVWRMADREWILAAVPTAQWLPCILNIELFLESHT